MRPRAYTRRDSLGLLAAMFATSLVPGRGRGGPTAGGDGRFLTTHVRGEFGRLRAAVVHDASNAVDVTADDYRQLVSADVLARHPETGPSSRGRVVEQLAGFRRLLAGEGVDLVPPEPQPGAFCQVFARDPCFVIGETLFVGGLRDEWRLAETAGLRDLCRQVRRVFDLSDDGVTVEGGDIMILDPGERVLVGMNRHTDERGFRRLSRALASAGTEAIRVPHRALHLDCCLAPLPNGEALYARGKLPHASVIDLGGYFERLIPLDRDEAALHLAANLFWLDERRVVSGVAARKTNALLREKGYDVLELDFSDLIRLWGSFRCVACPLERE